MKKITVLILMILLVIVPAAPAHAIGLLKYTWDMVANQLGLDRGPVPKVIPKRHVPEWDKYGKRIPRHAYFPSFHLQAEGF